MGSSKLVWSRKGFVVMTMISLRNDLREFQELIDIFQVIMKEDSLDLVADEQFLR
jgi:hypothetical protein